LDVKQTLMISNALVWW